MQSPFTLSQTGPDWLSALDERGEVLARHSSVSLSKNWRWGNCHSPEDKTPWPMLWKVFINPYEQNKNVIFEWLPLVISTLFKDFFTLSWKNKDAIPVKLPKPELEVALWGHPFLMALFIPNKLVTKQFSDWRRIYFNLCFPCSGVLSFAKCDWFYVSQTIRV